MNTDNTVLIVGKGPSLRHVKRGESYEVAALNTASEFCEHIDYLFINDFIAYDRQIEGIWDRVDNLILPTFPHGDDCKPDINKDFTWISKRTPHNVNLWLHELQSAPIKNPKDENFGPVATVGETAVAWLLKRGFRKFVSVGLDPDICAYHKTFIAKGEKPASYMDSWHGIERRLKEKGATIKRLAIPEDVNIDDDTIKEAL